MKRKMKKIDLYITDLQYEFLKRESQERGITFSEMLRKMVDWYVEEKSEK